ncbi:hypothetical protein LLNCDO702_07280 [Lactococcus lactis subsp. lactis]
MSEIINCPVCSHLLIKEQNTYKCENNHTFDLAKEGYLNLLLNAKKTSGDSKEMMAARRDFLAKGYYEKLSDRVNQRLKKSHLTDQAILDIGCGEGYYLSRCQKEIAPKASNFYGMDISKLGIRMAAKKNPMIH